MAETSERPEDWSGGIIVIEHGGPDQAPACAWRGPGHIVVAPGVTYLEAFRELGVGANTGGLVFFLDGDERVPASVADHHDDFDEYVQL